MRLGELLALTYDDVDTDRRTITINKSFRAGVVGDPKTNNGYRDIPMTDTLLEVVKRKRATALTAALKTGSGKPVLIFSGKAGKHISQNTIRYRWKALLKKSGIKYRKFHAVRHTFVSHLLAAGVLPVEVCMLAGHHAPSFTLDKYGHAMPGKESPISVLEQVNS